MGNYRSRAVISVGMPLFVYLIRHWRSPQIVPNSPLSTRELLISGKRISKVDLPKNPLI